MTLATPAVSDTVLAIGVVNGPPGCGKTSLMRRAAINQLGRYIFAFPTIDLIREQLAEFRREAPWLAVAEVHSECSSRPIDRQLKDAAAALSADCQEHAVILITHTVALGHDLSAFRGWHFRMDEAPDAVRAGTISLQGGSHYQWANTFDLEPIGTSGWAQLVPREDGKSWHDIGQDTLLRAAGPLINQAQKAGGAMVDIRDWAEVNRFRWCSIWLPTSLASFATIEIGGAGYLSSLGAHLCRSLLGDGIDFAIRDATVSRSRQPSIEVRYFRFEECTTVFWAATEGRRVLALISDHLRSTCPHLGFWSGNDAVRSYLDHRLPGLAIAPKAAGLNAHRARTCCAIFYSSKATPQDSVLVQEFGLSKDMIRTAREDEDIYQFAFRGAIREPSYGGQYLVYVYSRAQALRLAEKFTSAGLTDVAVNLEAVPGLAVAPTSSSLTTKTVLTDAQRRERKSLRQKARRANIAAAKGREAGRAGRPPRQRDP